MLKKVKSEFEMDSSHVYKVEQWNTDKMLSPKQ